jgi:hypothetical protein
VGHAQRFRAFRRLSGPAFELGHEVRRVSAPVPVAPAPAAGERRAA